ncbi:MAG: hypothetical protein ACYDEO_24005 [Aggregatilineales bacterium]
MSVVASIAERPSPRRIDRTALTTPRLMTAILFILLFVIAARVPVDSDTWWHLRSGSVILATHTIPYTDTFSLTRAGQSWIDQSWLSQVVMSAVFQLAGNVGLALLTAALATLGMIFTFKACRGSVYLRAFVMVLSATTAAVFWSPRPQMASFVLSTVVLYLLYQYKRNVFDRLWLIPLLMALWVNLHSGFAIGFIFLGAFIVGEVFNRQPWPHVRKLIIITALSAVALLLNPYTVRMLLYPFQTAGLGVLEQFIQEWASPDFHMRETWPFLILLFGTMTAAGFSKQGWDWTDLALTAGTAALALVWQRNFAVFAIAAAPTLCDHSTTILENAGLRLLPSRPPHRSTLILNWSILAILAAAALLKLAVTLSLVTIAQAQSETLPVQAVAYLNRVNPPGPMFNSYNWGGYLMFAAPNYPVFVDGRTDLYGSAFLSQWRNVLYGVGWQNLFTQWKIRLVVIEHDSPLAGILRGDAAWRETYADTQASVFERQSPAS